MRLVLAILNYINVCLCSPKWLLTAAYVDGRGAYLAALVGGWVVIIVQLARKVEAYNSNLCAVKRRGRIVLKYRNKRQYLTF